MATATARSIEDIYELAPAQAGMLFDSVADPAAGLYVVQLRCRLVGAPAGPALAQVLQQVVDRHGALRTSFHWREAAKPLQVVHRRAALAVDQLDWRGLTPAGQAEALAAYLDADRRRGFDLGAPPLMRVALMRLDEATTELAWTLHHLILDGWSLALLMRELRLRVGALDGGTEPALPAPRPYADYVAWLQRQDPAASEAYWRRALAGLPAAPPLLPAGGDGAAGERRTELSEAATAALAAVARRERLTVGTIVQGAWASVLGRLTGRREVVFGVTVSGRPASLAGVESMVGMFVNTLPVRVELPTGQPGPWLAGLQTQQAEMRQHQHASLAEIRRWSGLPARVPLFESVVAFENYPSEAAPSGPLRVREIEAVERTSYPLTLVAGPGARLSLKLLHDRGSLQSVATDVLAELTRLLETWGSSDRAVLGAHPPTGFALPGRSQGADGTLRPPPREPSDRVVSVAHAPTGFAAPGAPHRPAASRSPASAPAPRSPAARGGLAGAAGAQPNVVGRQSPPARGSRGPEAPAISQGGRSPRAGGHRAAPDPRPATHRAAPDPHRAAPAAHRAAPDPHRAAPDSYRAAPDSYRAAPDPGPAPALADSVALICSRLLSLPSIPLQADLFDLGLDSLLALRLVSDIERELGQAIPVSALFPTTSVERLAAQLRAPTPSERLLPIQPRGARRPLFGVHPLGGSAACYRALARHLGPNQPLYGLDDPCQRLDATVERLATTGVAALQSVQAAGPYALAGWSYGGALAFEIAVQLRDRGHEVALLALLDSAAPADVAARLAGVGAADVPSLLRAQLGGVLTEAALRHWTARLRALCAYTPRPYGGRVVLFQAAGHGGLAAGWAPLCPGGLETFALAGSHETIVAEPHVAALAARLRACLDPEQASQDGEIGSQGW